MSFRPRVIPCLLLSGRGLVKTLQFRDPVYVGDPINAVRIFNDAEADELMLLDIDAGAKNQAIRFDLVKQIAEEAYMPLTYGGGIRTLEDVRQLIQSGAEKIVLRSVLEEGTALLSEVASRYGSQAVVACIDVKKEKQGYAAVRPSSKEGLSCIELARRFEAAGAGEIMIQLMDRDGTESGYDYELVSAMAAGLNIPLIAAGGAASLDDIRAVTRHGASAAAAGSLFCFLGSRNSVMINYPDKKELNAVFAQ